MFNQDVSRNFLNDFELFSVKLTCIEIMLISDFFFKRFFSGKIKKRFLFN